MSIDDPDALSEALAAKPFKRLRLSVWAGSHLINPATVKAGEKIIDDITLLKTLSVNVDNKHVAKTAPPPPKKPDDKPPPPPKVVAVKSLEVIFDPDVHGVPDTFYGKAIDACHQVGIQCLAGWDMARNDFPMQAFAIWLNDLHAGKFPDKDKEIDRVVQQLVKLVNQDFHASDKPGEGKVVHFDGISFDIEAVPGDVGDEIVAFYKAVAEKFADARSDTNKFVGVAAGALVDDTHAHFVRDAASGDIKFKQPAMASAIANRWDMTNDAALLVLRPMAYDDWPLTNLPPPPTSLSSVAPPSPPANYQQPAKLITEWHNDLMDYAKSKAVPEEQFQLGIKTFPGAANTPKPFTKADGTLAWGGQDGCMTDERDIRRRCRELRRRGYGLILFAFPEKETKSFWDKVKTYNFALNADHDVPEAFDDKPTQASDPEFQKNGNPWDGTIVPAKRTVPRQQPHTLNTMDRLKNH
jgi:hypothetical protein